MSLYKCLLLFLPILAHSTYVPGTPGAAWSQQEILDVKAKLRVIFRNPWGPMKKALEILGYPPETFNTDQHSEEGIYGNWRIPSPQKFLRLSFHDCVKYKDGTGGCDGCLNWEGVGLMLTEDKWNKTVKEVKFTNNNGLRPSVEILEAIYTTRDFPDAAPVLSQSLKESGKSRADLWSLAAIVSIEWGVETNNLVCSNSSDIHMNGKGECHHLLGEEGCEVTMPKIPFRTGRSDCEVSDPARPYIAEKEEVHPNAVGSGYETMEFFQSQFGLNGQEAVALLGAHTFGRFFIMNSLFRYTWTSSGTRLFNNDYFKMITNKQRWYFTDPGVCTKVGDAYGNKPERRWLTVFLGDAQNGGPVFWVSENYVCPNCVKGGEPWWRDIEKECCKPENIPAGNFCVPDEKRLDEKVLRLGEQEQGCERWRIIVGVDEMALPAEMGLYFDFNQTNGFPTGCPGLERFHQGEGGINWSATGWARSDPGCDKQSLAIPATDKPTSWYMDEYAKDQALWIRDFGDVMDKMMANGYDIEDLNLEFDEIKEVACSPRRNGQWYFQCWEDTPAEGDEFTIESQLDGRVIQVNEETGTMEMWERINGDLSQQWRWNKNKDQLINSKNGELLEVQGLVLWTLGEADEKGYSRLIAKGMKWTNLDERRAIDRGWKRENGQVMWTYNEHLGRSSGFKLTPVVSMDACETESESPFSIENKRTGKVLTINPSTGEVFAAKKNNGAPTQLWKWSNSCELPGSYLVNVETGTFLGLRVTESSATRESNSWEYDEENETLKSSTGFAREYKKKKLGMDSNVRLSKKTNKPWKWFQWTLVEN